MKVSQSTFGEACYARNILSDAIRLMHKPDPTPEQRAAAWRCLLAAEEKLREAKRGFAAEDREAVYDAMHLPPAAVPARPPVCTAFATVEQEPGNRAENRLAPVEQLPRRPMIPAFRPTHKFDPSARRLVALSGTITTYPRPA